MVHSTSQTSTTSHDTTPSSTSTSTATRSQDIPTLLSEGEDRCTVSELEQRLVYEGLHAEAGQRHYLIVPRIMQHHGMHRSRLSLEDPRALGRLQVDKEFYCRRVLEAWQEPEQRKGISTSRAGTSSTPCLPVTPTSPSFLPRPRDPSTHLQDEDNDVGMPLDDNDIPTAITTTSTRPMVIAIPSTTMFPTVILPDLHQYATDSLAPTMLHSTDTSLIFELDL